MILHSPNPLHPFLLSVTLHNCKITFLSSDYILENSDFQVIDLSSNFLRAIQQDTFLNLLHVEVISLANNILDTIQTSSFKNLPSARTINFTNNFLSEIQISAFVNLPQLEYLDFSNNMLRNLPWEGISNFSNLRALGLKGNRWNCSCDMSGILYVNHSLIAGTNATCSYPEALDGLLLEHLTPRHFQHCRMEMNGYTKLSITLLVLSIISVCLIYPMSLRSPNNIKQSIKRVGQIEFDCNAMLGKSGNVFKGRVMNDGRNAAVKKHLKDARKELDILLEMSENGSPHLNVVRFLCVEYESKFMYLALELCDGDLLTAIIDNNEDLVGEFKPDICFLQLARGLNYLHKLKIEHRDIKPKNILWKKRDTVRFIISDFDMGHFSNEVSSHKVRFGTAGWTAPELWNAEERKTSVDIFSLGCVFYFVITRGGHPFGVITDTSTCQDNIISEEYSFNLDGVFEQYKESPYLAFLARDLITKMISIDPAERPKASDVLNHPLLCTSGDMLHFFDEVGKCVEDKTDQGIIAFKEMLEHGAATVFEGTWKERLDKAVRNDCKQFNEHQLCSLLRVIRNKIQHFEKLGPKLRENLSGNHEGVVNYFLGHFPKALIYTYSVVKESGLENRLVKPESL